MFAPFQESLPKPKEEKGVLEEPKKSMLSILWDSFGALVKARPGIIIIGLPCVTSRGWGQWASDMAFYKSY